MSKIVRNRQKAVKQRFLTYIIIPFYKLIEIYNINLLWGHLAQKKLSVDGLMIGIF